VLVLLSRAAWTGGITPNLRFVVVHRHQDSPLCVSARIFEYVAEPPTESGSDELALASVFGVVSANGGRLIKAVFVAEHRDRLPCNNGVSLRMLDAEQDAEIGQVLRFRPLECVQNRLPMERNRSRAGKNAKTWDWAFQGLANRTTPPHREARR
jgi:hypothetical protein